MASRRVATASEFCACEAHRRVVGGNGVQAQDILEQLAAHGTPSPGVARRIDVGSGPYLRFFEEELLSGLVEMGAAACRIYEGAYGAGKTHLLQLIAETALARGAAVVQADLSHDLQLSDWRGLIEHILQEIRLEDEQGNVHRGSRPS